MVFNELKAGGGAGCVKTLSIFLAITLATFILILNIDKFVCVCVCESALFSQHKSVRTHKFVKYMKSALCCVLYRVHYSALLVCLIFHATIELV